MSAYEEFSVLDADGGAGDHDPGLSDAELLHCYRTMLMVRAFDDTAMKLQRSGRIGFSIPPLRCQYQAMVMKTLEMISRAMVGIGASFGTGERFGTARGGGASDRAKRPLQAPNPSPIGSAPLGP